MCMIAAYIGHRSAAEVLLAMTRKQEGIFGGFSTGIGTIHGGRLHRVRVVGSVEQLEREIGSDLLVGNIGIAHSRTDDGGGIEWAQPRFDSEGRVASVGVGIGGCFPSRGSVLRFAEEHLRDGVSYATRTSAPKKNAVQLPDGCSVHGGEVVLEELARRYGGGMSFAEAVRSMDLRSESVGLYLTSSEPDCFYVVNHNQRVVVGRKGGETFLATSRLALPEGLEWSVVIPMNTFAVVREGDVRLEQLWSDEPLFYFEEVPGVRDAVRRFVERERSVTYWNIVSKAIEPLFPGDRATRASMLGHELIEELVGEGVVRVETRAVVGVDGQRVPQFVFVRGGRDSLRPDGCP